jgi:outer membrane protein OmpA-like peptidoglycan-associated protein
MPVAAPLPAPAAAPARSYLVFFDPNAAALTDRARQIIAEAASMTKAIHVRQFIVTGYTDAVGTPSDRYAIALERAKTVADQLVADGADRSILSVGSYGSTYQLVPDPDGTAVPQNRRVEIIIQ